MVAVHALAPIRVFLIGLFSSVSLEISLPGLEFMRAFSSGIAVRVVGNILQTRVVGRASSMMEEP